VAKVFEATDLAYGVVEMSSCRPRRRIGIEFHWRRCQGSDKFLLLQILVAAGQGDASKSGGCCRRIIQSSKNASHPERCPSATKPSAYVSKSLCFYRNLFHDGVHALGLVIYFKAAVVRRYERALLQVQEVELWRRRSVTDGVLRTALMRGRKTLF
jgi:hypothetical protein